MDVEGILDKCEFASSDIVSAHTMLFVLVPLNQLSSSFTRIDGTVFDGMPCEFSACRALLACSGGPSTAL